MLVEGETAIVTGCWRVKGFEISKKFLQKGAITAGYDLNQKNTDIVKEELQDYVKFERFKCDVSSFRKTREFVVSTASSSGKQIVDILVSNARMGTYTKFIDIETKVWLRVLGLNLTGVFNMCKVVILLMIENSSEVILNISPTNGILTEGMLSPCDISKAGFVLFTNSLTLELGKYGIRVVLISPEFILTEIKQDGKLSEEIIQNYNNNTLIGGYWKAEGISKAFVLLNSKEASFISGSKLVVDGG